MMTLLILLGVVGVISYIIYANIIRRRNSALEALGSIMFSCVNGMI